MTLRLIASCAFLACLALGDQSPAAPEVHVLTEGYVAPIEGAEFDPGKTDTGRRRVAGTVVLVQADGATIVGDPGMVADRQQILGGLAEHGVTPEDVTHVFISHHHPDHTVNIGMFPNAKVVDFWGEFQNDIWSDHGDDYELAPGVRVIRTPGHTKEDASLVVETAGGVVVFTHVWWNERMQPAVDPLAEAPEKLDASRLRVLELADWIIPGHGKKFANPDRE